jgi:RecA/RadA recombinase
MLEALAYLTTVRCSRSTGITGLDEITGGGLPRGRTTLLMGGPGSGKTNSGTAIPRARCARL